MVYVIQKNQIQLILSIGHKLMEKTNLIFKIIFVTNEFPKHKLTNIWFCIIRL